MATKKRTITDIDKEIDKLIDEKRELTRRKWKKNEYVIKSINFVLNASEYLKQKDYILFWGNQNAIVVIDDIDDFVISIEYGSDCDTVEFEDIDENYYNKLVRYLKAYKLTEVPIDG